MSTQDIRGMLQRNEKTRGYLLDVYGADELPTKKVERSVWLLVCNCCPIDQPGEHWIAMFGDANGNIDFFDSYGLSPAVYSWAMAFIRAQNPRSINYNSVQLQSLASDVCGEYCLYFCHHRACDAIMTTIIERLERATRDDFVRCTVHNVIYI